MNEILNLIGEGNIEKALWLVGLLAVASLEFHFSIKLKDGKWEIEFSISRKKN
ncbi:hypothetical protein [Paenibacillus dendritiformis]|uniref:hypothetical protein n=1 Tax=Paenibacillus dendritiformis TaxID=130049 RepID=UPI00387E18DC